MKIIQTYSSLFGGLTPAESKQFDRNTPEGKSALIEFCRKRKHAGALELGRKNQKTKRPVKQK